MDNMPPVLSSSETAEFYFDAESVQEFSASSSQNTEEDSETFSGLVFTNKRALLFRENDITDVLYSEIGSLSLTHKEKSISVDTGLRYFLTGFSIVILWSLVVSFTSLSTFVSFPQTYLYIPGVVASLLFSSLGAYVFYRENTVVPERYVLTLRTSQTEPIELTIETTEDLETILIPLLRREMLQG
jgi:hypothetical protein